MNYENFIEKSYQDILNKLNNKISEIKLKAVKKCTIPDTGVGGAGNDFSVHNRFIYNVFISITVSGYEMAEVEGLILDASLQYGDNYPEKKQLNFSFILQYMSELGGLLEDFENYSDNCTIQILDEEVQISYDNFILELNKFIDDVSIPRLINEINNSFPNAPNRE